MLIYHFWVLYFAFAQHFISCTVWEAPVVHLFHKRNNQKKICVTKEVKKYTYMHISVYLKYTFLSRQYLCVLLRPQSHKSMLQVNIWTGGGKQAFLDQLAQLNSFLSLCLPDEREAVQKKTFTKWVNSILARVSCRISDLYLDLRDGRMLIKLLEVLSGERLVSIC